MIKIPKNAGEIIRQTRLGLSLNQKEFGDLMGVGQSRISDFESGAKLPNKSFWAYFKYRYIDCGAAPGDCYKSDSSDAVTSNGVPKQDSKRRNVIEVEHSNLIKQFKNKEQAKAINKDLIHLESMNEEAFREVGTYIKGLIQGLKLATGRGVRPDRRNHDRRQQSDDDKIPDGVDRRSGNDRRRTGT